MIEETLGVRYLLQLSSVRISSYVRGRLAKFSLNKNFVNLFSQSTNSVCLLCATHCLCVGVDVIVKKR